MEFLQVPIAEELARYADKHNAVLYFYDRGFTKPGIKVCRRDGKLDLSENVFPELTGVESIHRIHREVVYPV